ncbi:MAG: histidinol phosphate phosphatase [Sphingobacteriales bacterium SCN 48-20]|uniref:HAD-IIIA family hydrolase n=1 Tax=Terrimonas ferruginea TaxID=249 RepID=UPI00086F040B|nr:HAD-IIIA family hydrolase [Terrimonas ferruginea]MBN8782916.1 HAD-IIIA family hydrolase [Terrimonas ferruginea]ODT91960.1 MAG: histidinol phosphate phosphatase [Sphingobacteriales bacterium SCN 48-20]OJW44109.1 MAG: histidinol phosphate phosphatase [Sphingobacteriales bacterium 48-107]
MTQAIILAGGLGTRLRSAVPDLPKCLAPVAGRPFLFYVINYLRSQGINDFIFSLGYKHELITDYLERDFATLSYKTVIEEEPLGTGGAIRLAAAQAHSSQVIVTNGDTLFRADIPAMLQLHNSSHAVCTLALKPMNHFDRYGVVEINDEGRITAFKEKQQYEQGTINGGLYVIDREALLATALAEKFSFEKDFLEARYAQDKLYGIAQDNYFIDIGIPDDYNQAQQDLARPAISLKDIDKSWTLFMDRDGVFNHDKVGSYVFHPDEFVFYDGALDATRIIHEKFGRVIVTTNQRGVGRGLMTLEDLKTVNDKLQRIVKENGGQIDHVYSATAMSNFDPIRKPNPGMAFLAKHDFPDIDLSKTIMIGNNPSDMQFGRHAGLYTVYLTTTNPPYELPHQDVDWQFESLYAFAKSL